MTDLSGMIARIEDLEQRHAHDQMALQSNAKQLEELRAELEQVKHELAVVRSAHAKDTARLLHERDTWKAEAMQRIADRTFA